MAVDRLEALLHRFAVSARMFHSGPLCGVNDIPIADGWGQLHLVRRGPLEVRHGREHALTVGEATLIFYPRPHPHRFVSDPEVGADMACANVAFDGAAFNPIAQALPPFVALPLAALPDAALALDLLFAEAFAQRCGRQAVVDRLFEVVLILLLRRLLDEGAVEGGLLAGLAHPKLAKALVAIHAAPGEAWPLERLAESAGMSRTAFAEAFRVTLGTTPGDYLARFRVMLAQDLLRRGRPLKLVVGEVGYGSSAALSRAFKATTGLAPRAFRRAN